jgi:hypothetical protein
MENGLEFLGTMPICDFIHTANIFTSRLSSR